MQSTPYSQKFPRAGLFRDIRLILALALLIVATTARSLAQISLTATDAAGTSSFNAGGNWTGGQAPSAQNDYVVNGFYLRTPENNASPHVFAGRSLTVQGGGALLLKSTASATVRVDALTLNNGFVSHFGAGGSTISLAGSMRVASGGAHLYAGNGSLWINSATTLDGNAIVWGSLDPSLSVQTFGAFVFNTGGRLTLSATTNVNNSVADVNFIQAFSSVYVFNIDSDLEEAYISGEGTLSRIDATFGGKFEFNLTGLDYDIGDSWQIVNHGSIGGALSYSGSFSVNGFTETTAGIWTSANGSLQFSEATGYLTAIAAIPEPSVFGLVAAGAAVLSMGSRRRRK